MKKLCIFGADGRTGIPTVHYAVSRGFEVTACIYYDKSRAQVATASRIITGNVLDPQYALRAIEGVDAVVSVLGHIKGSDPRIQTKGIQNIVDAMHEHQVSRIVSLTGTGVRQPGDIPSIMDRVLNTVVRVVDPERVADGIAHAKVLQASGLDWTILRVLKLTNGAFDGSYTLTPHGPVELTSPRTKVAEMLVDLAEGGSYINEMPVSS